MAADDGMIVRARDAIARGAWSEAYEDLRAADPSALTGADLEGLADAAWWTSQFREALEARLRAYTAYVADGDEAAAAAVAARLSIEHFVRDEPSVGAGYLMRARRHADGLPEGPAHGFLAMVEANVARFSGAFEDAVASARRA
ncbi:MAG TPA: LuxR family transcriptional regulator, partial [Actinomycetota bacterium]